MSKVAV